MLVGFSTGARFCNRMRIGNNLHEPGVRVEQYYKRKAVKEMTVIFVTADGYQKRAADLPSEWIPLKTDNECYHDRPVAYYAKKQCRLLLQPALSANESLQFFATVILSLSLFT